MSRSSIANVSLIVQLSSMETRRKILVELCFITFENTIVKNPVVVLLCVRILLAHLASVSQWSHLARDTKVNDAFLSPYSGFGAVPAAFSLTAASGSLPVSAAPPLHTQGVDFGAQALQLPAQALVGMTAYLFQVCVRVCLCMFAAVCVCGSASIEMW